MNQLTDMVKASISLFRDKIANISNYYAACIIILNLSTEEHHADFKLDWKR